MLKEKEEEEEEWKKRGSVLLLYVLYSFTLNKPHLKLLRILKKERKKERNPLAMR